MGMVVRSNIMAVNAQRQLGMNNSQVSKSLEKLSSGYRINRAGDDASGLAISEKMKAQIRGLDTASLNAQDAISLVQTAEGALTETHNMLNRMVELATRSANGINNTTNRQQLQSEVDELLKEIDRITTSTTFNDTLLLDGSVKDGIGGVNGPAGDVAEFTDPGDMTITSPTDGDGTSTKAKFDIKVDGFAGTKAGTVDVKIGDVVIGTVDVTEGMTDAEFAQALNGQKFTVQDTAGNDLEFTASATGTTVTFEAATASAIALSGGSADFDVTGGYTIEAQQPAAGAATAAAGDTDAAAAPDFSQAKDIVVAGATSGNGKADATGLKGDAIQTVIDALAKDDDTIKGGKVTIEYNATDSVYELKAGDTVIGKSAAGDKIDTADATTGATLNFTGVDAAKTALGSITVKADTGTINGELKAALDTGVEAKPAGAEDNNGGGAGGTSSFVMQIGDKKGDIIQIDIDCMNATALGVNGLDITTRANANAAIDTVKDAIDTVSTQRASLGALQNRLEYTINNLDTASENIQAANSRIRDTDMAKMMMEYTKINVLTQSAQAMLAQANQQPQSVLQLLQ